MQQNKLKRGGFTLTEVMIGIMILTVAIVSATNLLIGLVQTNRNNLTTMQAYYLAQEGLEAVRNVRDTNWLNNMDWLAPHDNPWGQGFTVGGKDGYNVVLLNPTDNSPDAKPWRVELFSDLGQGILKNKNSFYLSSNSGATENVSGVDASGFKRVISIEDYCDSLDKSGELASCTKDPTDTQQKFVRVKSTVSWSIGSKQRDVTLYSVLSNWKGGAL